LHLLRALATEVQEWQHHRRLIMIRIKVQYDAYNRAFKLVDRGLGSLLEDYALYDLSIPYTAEETEDQDSFTLFELPVANA
jgi:hypothetical protein